MKKLISMSIIILLLPIIAFASTPSIPSESYVFYVENTTMVDAYYTIFNAIGALFKSDEYLDLLRLAFLIGGFFVFSAGVVSSFEGNGGTKLISPYAKYLVVGVALLTLIFSQKTTMFVTTNNIPSLCSTSSPHTGFAVELPSILAYTFKTTNTIGKGLTELAESAMSNVSGITDSGQGDATMIKSDGYLGALKQSIKVLTFNPNRATLNNSSSMTNTDKSDFTDLWTRYFAVCVYQNANNKGVEGDEVISEMVSSDNLYNWAKEHLNYQYEGTTFTVGETYVEWMGGNTTCNNYFSVLETSTQTLLDNFTCTMPLAHGGVLELLTKQNAAGKAAAVTELTGIARQSGLINAVRNASKINSIGIQGANSFTGGTSRADGTMQSLSTASYMSQMLPYIQMTMRAVLYAFFPFVFVVVLLPGGIKVLIQYLQTMIWIELWGPTAAIVNMFMNLQVKATVGDEYTQNGLTIISSIDMLSEANTIAAVGATLYLSIPPLTWLILKGSGHMLGNITQGYSSYFSNKLKDNMSGKNIEKDEQLASINRKRALDGKQAISYGEMIHYEQRAAGAALAGSYMGAQNTGLQSKTDAAEQKETTENKAAELNKALAGGSNKNVGQIKAADMAKQFNTTKEQMQLEGVADSNGNVKMDALKHYTGRNAAINAAKTFANSEHTGQYMAATGASLGEAAKAFGQQDGSVNATKYFEWKDAWDKHGKSHNLDLTTEEGRAANSASIGSTKGTDDYLDLEKREQRIAKLSGMSAIKYSPNSDSANASIKNQLNKQFGKGTVSDVKMNEDGSYTAYGKNGEQLLKGQNGQFARSNDGRIAMSEKGFDGFVKKARAIGSGMAINEVSGAHTHDKNDDGIITQKEALSAIEEKTDINQDEHIKKDAEVQARTGGEQSEMEKDAKVMAQQSVQNVASIKGQTEALKDIGNDLQNSDNAEIKSLVAEAKEKGYKTNAEIGAYAVASLREDTGAYQTREQKAVQNRLEEKGYDAEKRGLLKSNSAVGEMHVEQEAVNLLGKDGAEYVHAASHAMKTGGPLQKIAGTFAAAYTATKMAKSDFFNNKGNLDKNLKRQEELEAKKRNSMSNLNESDKKELEKLKKDETKLKKDYNNSKDRVKRNAKKAAIIGTVLAAGTHALREKDFISTETQNNINKFASDISDTVDDTFSIVGTAAEDLIESISGQDVNATGNTGESIRNLIDNIDRRIVEWTK